MIAGLAVSMKSMRTEQIEVVLHPDLGPALAEYGLREVHAVEREEDPLVFPWWHDFGRSSDGRPAFRDDTTRRKD